MNRTLDLGFLVLSFLGLLPLRLCCLLGGVVVLGRLLLMNRTVPVTTTVMAVKAYSRTQAKF